MSNISIFGGTGYLGYHLTVALAKEGHKIKIFTRKLAIQSDLQGFTNVMFVKFPKTDRELELALSGTEILINLVGSLDISSKRLKKAHVDLPKKLFEIAHEVGVNHMIHMSALGALDNAKSKYFKTKFEAESALMTRAKDLPVRLSILKPSLIFGQQDAFFGRFIRLINLFPFFLLPCANAEFQPVYIQDVVKAVLKIIDRHEQNIEVYELAGPKRYTFIELLRTGLKYSGVNPNKVGKMPQFMAALLGRCIGWIPKAPFNYDQYLSLKVPNVSDKNDLARLGVTPTSLESVLAIEYQAGLYDAYYKDRITANRDNNMINH